MTQLTTSVLSPKEKKFLIGANRGGVWKKQYCHPNRMRYLIRTRLERWGIVVIYPEHFQLTKAGMELAKKVAEERKLEKNGNKL